MNQSERWAKRAFKHVRVLVQGIGPRGATSDGERRAAEYVRDELARFGLDDVRLEAFQGAVSIWLPYAIAFSLAAWGMLVGLLFGLVGGILAAILYLAAAWILYREFHPSVGGHSARRWLWQGKSQNVVAVAAPDGAVERRAVLMANLDSPRTPFFWRKRGRRRLAGCLVWPLFLSLLLNGLFLLLGATTGNVLYYFAALFFIFPQAAALIANVYAERTPFSAGANNNASGVGALLAVAERLSQQPLAQTEVWLLASGCRETGGDGIRAFLAAHGNTLSEAIFVALQGVGVGERVVYLTGERVLRGTSFDPQALAVAARATEHCQAQGLAVSAGQHRGNPTEVGLVVRRGLAGFVVNAWPEDRAGVARRRRADDTLEAIEKETLAQTHAFVWTVLQEIDAGLEGLT